MEPRGQGSYICRAFRELVEEAGKPLLPPPPCRGMGIQYYPTWRGNNT